jgi:glycosyltransferase involved in cell wall biosynthesis
MRGLLVCPISADFPGNRGILNKMAYQRSALEELAGAADVICNGIEGPLFDGHRFATYALTGRPFNSFNHFVLFYKHATKLCVSRQYDFVYIRYPLAHPSFLRFLRDIKRSQPDLKVVLEVPTFPYRNELRSPKQRVLLALDDIGHRHLKKYVDAVVTFFGQSEIHGIPCIQVANGVDVDSIRFRERPRNGAELRILVAANLADWHGIDRVLRGLDEYRLQQANPDVTLSIVGDGPAASQLRTLSHELELADVVQFHGLRTGAELDALFEEADLALGSLGMHRLGLERSSSLKTREYCARGIPFVLASEDPDFERDFPFVLHVAADDSPADIEAFVRFMKELRERYPDYPTEMRRHAETHLTWKAKLDPVIEYIRTGKVPT